MKFKRIVKKTNQSLFDNNSLNDYGLKNST